MKHFLLVFAVVFLSAGFVFSQQNYLLNDPDNSYQVSLSAEAGAVKVLSHTLQFGTNGTLFDYVKNGSQNILFPFYRLTAEVEINKKHSLIFLYQPLEIITKTWATEDVIVEGVTFTNGSAINLKYGFSFWRMSYLYHLIDNGQTELSLGVSLQIRNASIYFESIDGSQFTINQNIGPVPILKGRFSYQFDSGFYIGAEVDGFYASSKIFNGSTYEFEGSILDASVRCGLKLTDYMDMFINLRYLGGGATGTEVEGYRTGVDGYTDNHLSTFAVTLGTVIR